MVLAKKVTEGVASAETMAELDRNRRDMAFLGREWRELTSQYTNEWIAIERERVVAHAVDHGALLDELHRLDIHPTDALIEYLTDTPLILSTRA